MIFAFQAIPHVFRFIADKPVTTVNIAGTFNGWDKAATPLHKTSDRKTWEVTLNLAPGKIQYKFVLNGSDWTLDPNSPHEGDGNGNENSYYLLRPSDYSQPARKGDGHIATSAVMHIQEVPYLNFDRGQLSLELRVRPSDVQAISVFVNGKRYRMTEFPGDDVYAIAKASVPWNRQTTLTYSFELSDGSLVKRYGTNGFSGKPSPFVLDSKKFRPITVPNWTEGTVLYSIFPDRFANGDKSNDPKNVKPWGSEPNYRDFNGGDIAGVRQHMAYLKSLGIGGIYFCPIFASPVNHRYETTDYRKVDPAFGTNEELKTLTHELKSNGIRTILDGVFNHTATQFFAFNDVVKKGASSPYTDWYWFKSFPVRIGENPNYVAWYNYPSLPKFNANGAGPKRYLLDTAKFWNQNIDIGGWRLDVAQDVSQDFWRAFRKQVKSLDPEAWIVGENWGNSQTWLKGDQWDSVMNYPFAFSVIGFLKPGSEVTPNQFLGNLFANYNLYTPQVSRNLMNLLGSHDTARVLTQLEGRSDLRDLAAVLQLTWPGTPCIYYGDELGMAGGKDPDNRRCVDWSLDNANNPTLNLYRQLISIRNSSEELKHGEPVQLGKFEDSVVFGRTYQGKTAIVAINRSDTGTIVTIPRRILGPNTGNLKVAFGEGVTQNKTTIVIRLDPMRAAILVPDRGLQSSTSPRSIEGATSIPRSEKK